MADPGPAAVLAGNVHLDRLLLPPRRGASFAVQREFLKRLRAERYDWVLDLFGNPRSAWITLLSGAPLRAGYAYRLRRHAFTHAVERNVERRYQVAVNLGLLSALGVPDDGLETEMVLEAAEKRWAGAALSDLGLEPGAGKPLVALNPTGTWPAKKWPIRYWIELVHQWSAVAGARPLLLWGPGDETDARRIAEGAKGLVAVAPPTDLRQLASLIARCDLLIGNDGAPQHIARALGVATLTLHGPTWGISWCPPKDPRHRFLQHFPPCGPCDRTRCPHPPVPRPDGRVHQECLVKIPPTRVTAVALEMLEWSGGRSAPGKNGGDAISGAQPA